MWGWIGPLLTWVLGLFTGGNKSETQQASETGEKLGKAEQQAAEGQAQTASVGAANEAREQVKEQTSKDPDSIKADDGFRRD